MPSLTTQCATLGVESLSLQSCGCQCGAALHTFRTSASRALDLLQLAHLRPANWFTHNLVVTTPILSDSGQAFDVQVLLRLL